MSPRELRAFRESTGASRREFARQLFISEPTLERWERGKGGPRDVHLHLLRRMREQLSSPHRETYFQYDPAAADPVAELLGDQKRLVIETLRGMAALLLAQQCSEDGKDWALRFGLGWAAVDSLGVTLSCQGSVRPERPTLDFELTFAVNATAAGEMNGALQDACRSHGLFWSAAPSGDGRATLQLRHRLFKTGCNAETIRHVLRNYHSCWRRLSGAPCQPEATPTGVNS